jgi:hypothetical protein
MARYLHLAFATSFGELQAEVLRGAPTAPHRQSGRAGRNAAPGGHVSQMRANGAAPTRANAQAEAANMVAAAPLAGDLSVTATRSAAGNQPVDVRLGDYVAP